MPGIGLVMDGAMQQAPQPGRQAGAVAVLEEAGRVSGMGRLSAQVAQLRQPA
jgi:hypothetical protein